jgi:hypothetical protein
MLHYSYTVTQTKAKAPAVQHQEKVVQTKLNSGFLKPTKGTPAWKENMWSQRTIRWWKKQKYLY